MSSIDTILREASTILNAAQKHAVELSEYGVTDNEIHRLRTLIIYAAMHGYTHLENSENPSTVLQDLQTAKDRILWTAELKFGADNSILNEFRMAS